MLTTLQERILRVVADLPEATGFALAGGAALIVHGIVERPTRDLDFFSAHGEDVTRLLPALEAALATEGLSITVDRAEPGFARLTVGDGVDVTIVDLSHDFRLRPPVSTPFGPVISEEELGADKMLALFSRAEERDFIDVFHLARRLGLDRLCELASAKDPGFSRPRLAEAVGRFDRFERDGFEISGGAFAAVSQWVRELRVELEPPTPGPEPPGLSL